MILTNFEIGDLEIEIETHKLFLTHCLIFIILINDLYIIVGLTSTISPNKMNRRIKGATNGVMNRAIKTSKNIF